MATRPPPALETPPRAWGRPEIRGRNGSLFRNTPTSVGKTTSRGRSRRSSRKHPHERGEDWQSLLGLGIPCETPPRAWGRQMAGQRRGGRHGNTPTSVGKTPLRRPPQRRRRKHPHERGEDRGMAPGRERGRETPPRAWGRPARPCPTARNCGNTPTSVGKTMSMNWPGAMRRKHPHERGEDRGMAPGRERGRETPPRAWGRQAVERRWKTERRNTPTSVGKTY